MFKLKSGSSLNTPDITCVKYNTMVFAASHEIGQQVAIDVSVLREHYKNAQKYLSGCDIEFENVEFDAQSVMNAVLKFHIMDEEGVCKKLEPLVTAVSTKTPLQQNNPIITKVLVKSENYFQDTFNNNLSKVNDRIKTYDPEINTLFCDQMIKSYSAETKSFDIEICERGVVSCRCDHCKKYDNYSKDAVCQDAQELNPLQKYIAQSYKVVF